MQFNNTEYVDLMPEKLDPDTIYISDEYQSCQFICPCGCNQRTHIPFIRKGTRGESHLWTLSDSDGITLKPSLRQMTCKAHFFLNNSKVTYCSDTGT